MCNINLLLKKQNITSADLHFLDSVTYQSWTYNNDSEGYFTPQTRVRSMDKIFFAQERALLGAPFVAVHERMATGGVLAEKNAHPFASGRVVLMHNGVMDIRDEKGFKSDTHLFVLKFSALLDLGWSVPRAFKKCVKTISGSKSIVFYDTVEGVLYYYKNASTSFYISRNRNGFFASTSRENAEYAAWIYDGGEPVAVESGVLFQIKDNGRWVRVCKIDEPQPVVVKQSYGYNNLYPYANPSAYPKSYLSHLDSRDDYPDPDPSELIEDEDKGWDYSTVVNPVFGREQ